MTRFSFKKTQFVLLVIALICFAGIISYFNMSRAENPLYTVRIARVTTAWPGASPERVEQLVTDKIEKKIQEIPEVDYIESESKTGISIITVHVLDQYTNMRPIWDELRRKVEDAQKQLPESASIPFVNDEYGDIFGIVYAITWDGFQYREIKEIADNMRDEILELEDVAKVDIYGIQNERVFIDYNNDKLKEISLSPEQLRQIIVERNIIKSGGIIYLDKEQITLEPTGNYESIADIRDTLIEIPGTRNIVRLEDIADVYRGYVYPPTSIMHATGKPSLGLAISMRDGGNILTLGEQVTALLGQFEESYPIGVEMEWIAYQPERVIKKISDFVLNLIQAVVIVCIVMLLFLGFKTGLIVASLIPVVILITFYIMSTINLGLNQITLASLIIALGMLVDNAIVVSESILVQTSKGKKPKDAAIDSAKELRIPLLISSLTTSAAFLPFYLAESGTGEYVGSLFLVVTMTLLGSWVISLTMIPIFCVFSLKAKALLKKKEKPKKQIGEKFYRGYMRFLHTILCYRYVTLIALIGLFCLSIYGLGFVPKTFFPPSDTPMFTAEFELPVASSILRTEAVVSEIEAYMLENLQSEKKGIINWAAYIGNGGPRYRLQHDPEPPNSYYAFFLVNATSYKDMPETIAKLQEYVLNHFPDVKSKIRPLQEGTPVDYPVQVRVSGRDTETLFAMTTEIEHQLATYPGTKEIDDNWGRQATKVVINVDQERAKRAGITNSDIALSLESAINGVVLTEYREDDELIPMIFRSEAAKDVDLISTEAFNVYNQSTGVAIPLSQVAEVEVVWEPAIIFKRNRLKTVTISSELESGMTANEIDSQMIPWLEKHKWPLGYRYGIGGEKEEAGKAQHSIFVKLPIAAIIIVILLMAQFNSIRRTAIIVATIPMSMIGVVIGLLITRSYFGIMTILGIISLAGIIINNAIVLLDRIRIENVENGLDIRQAIIQAAKQRMRPICLTAVTTTAGLLPLWIGGGPLWEPMAISLIFGLLVGTVLTLGFVPVLYAIFFGISYKDFKLELP